MSLEQLLPKHILKNASFSNGAYAWHTNDIPEIIKIIADNDLINLGGGVRFIIPEEYGGGVCDPLIEQINTYQFVSTLLSWEEQVKKSAEIALNEFESNKEFFLEDAAKRIQPLLVQLGATDLDLQSITGFYWIFDDGSTYRKNAQTSDIKNIMNNARIAMNVRGDYETARSLLEPIVEHGNPAVQILMGDTYSCYSNEERNHGEAIKWYQKAAEQGCAQAWYILHMNYLWGHGVEKSEVKATEMLQKAADLGHDVAMSVLADRYKSGLGVEQNNVKAYEYYLKAATYGRPEAQGELGLMHLWGITTPVDYAEAYFWLTLAVRSSWNYKYLPKRFTAAKKLTVNELKIVENRIKKWEPIKAPFNMKDIFQ